MDSLTFFYSFDQFPVNSQFNLYCKHFWLLFDSCALKIVIRNVRGVINRVSGTYYINYGNYLLYSMKCDYKGKYIL